MNATAPVSFPHLANRKPMNVTVLLAMIVLGLGAAFPGYALDLVAFTGITGPLTSALTPTAALGVMGRGAGGFIAANDTLAGRTQNRRVELVFDLRDKERP